jgi:hypothetical protein
MDGTLDLLAISGAWLSNCVFIVTLGASFHEWFRDAEFLKDIG